MLIFTDSAREKIEGILQAKGQAGYAVRLRITGRDTDEFLYEFRSVERATRRADDLVIDAGGFEVFVDPESAPHLEGAEVDFAGLAGGGFKIENPNPVWEDDMSRAVAKVIAEKINPGVAAHSGRITLVDVKNGEALIRMQGGCQGCGLAGVTLRMGVEKAIKEEVPEIERVVDITEHEEGQTPYYTGSAGQSPVAQS
jgi:Fe/S biogenesis protein NfuA